MPVSDISKSGRFLIGGDLEVYRLGFGAMRITGNGIWGEPDDPDEARKTLRHVRELGINFIDTADAYGPDVSERLIHEVLSPYNGIVIATKGGLTRTGPNQWVPLGRPEYLIQQAYKSCRQLGVDQIDLWQLHRIDSKVPRKEQFDAIGSLRKAGVIRHVGLSEVTVEDIEEARQFFPVATVQNRYNVADRASESVLEYCERHQIGFIPWFPLGSGNLAKSAANLDQVAKVHGVSTGQVAIAWLLKRSPVMLPIPGTSKVAHLEENVASASVNLSDEEFQRLSRT